MALRAMLVLIFVLSVSSVAAESTENCQVSGSCASNTGGLSMIQFRQDSVKARTEAEMSEDEEDDDDDDEVEDEDEEDEDDDEEEKPSAKPGKGGKGKDFLKKLIAACEDKQAEDACSFEVKDGEAKEGTCVAKKDTLWCKPSGGKPGKGGKGAGEGKDEWMKKVVAACKEKEADEACSYEGQDGEDKNGTCVAKGKMMLWCKAAGGKPGKPGKGGKGKPGEEKDEEEDEEEEEEENEADEEDDDDDEEENEEEDDDNDEEEDNDDDDDEDDNDDE